MTNAFCLINLNPASISMHGFRCGDKFGLATHQNFGDCTSPGNFNISLEVRQQRAMYLFEHEKDRTLSRAKNVLNKVVLDKTDDDKRPFSPANKDKYNTGVFNKNNKQKLNPFIQHVDDSFFYNVEEHFPLAVAESVCSLEDTFGKPHKTQEKLLLRKKFKPKYREERQLLGNYPDSRDMIVKLSPR